MKSLRIKIEFNKIKEILGKIPRILAERAFFTFLALFFLALIFALFLFYKNVILAKKIQPEISEIPLGFEEKLFEKILREQNLRQKRFEETEKKQYPDPFWLKTPSPEILPEKELAPKELTP